MKLVSISIILLAAMAANAQELIYPAPAQEKTIYLQHATIHVGNGQVIENGSLVFSNGKITAVGSNLPVPAADVKVLDLQGKHVYPGLIAPLTTLGLTEIEAVRSTNDYSEVGEINPSVRSLVAYNTDSKVINTLRSNGILLAQVT